MRLVLFFHLCLVSTYHVSAQDDINYIDDVYLDYIASVKFHHKGLPASLPIIDLESSGKLDLSFDDLEGGEKDFNYRIIHCDKNWNPSDLDEYDYIEGFNDEEIREVNYSSGTFLDYTNYRLSLPNDDLQWTISGNYILAIYEDEYDTVPAITRRFMVVEPLLDIDLQVRRPVNVLNFKSHHELDVEINLQGVDVRNPQKDIQITLLQNNLWDTAITGLKPRSVRRDIVYFNYINKLNFPARKEYRMVDLRSTKYRGQGVHSIDRHLNGYEVIVQLDQNRNGINYSNYNDINGNYIITTVDEVDSDNLRSMQRLVRNLERNTDRILDQEYDLLEDLQDNFEISNHTESQYMNVNFGLDLANPILDGEVYIVGAFNDWQCNENSKMQYDYFKKMYTTTINLKQGFYNYQYVVKTEDEVDFEALEGNWFETENEYTVLTYFTEFGARYDRLIGVESTNSGRRN